MTGAKTRSRCVIYGRRQETDLAKHERRIQMTVTRLVLLAMGLFVVVFAVRFFFSSRK